MRERERERERRSTTKCAMGFVDVENECFDEVISLFSLLPFPFLLTAREAPQGRRRRPWRFRLQREEGGKKTRRRSSVLSFLMPKRESEGRESLFFLSLFSPLQSTLLSLLSRQSAGLSPPSLSRTHRVQLSLSLSQLLAPPCSLEIKRQQERKQRKEAKAAEPSQVVVVADSKKKKKENRRLERCSTPRRSWPRRARWAPSGSRRTWTGGSSGRRCSRPTSRRASVSFGENGWNSMSNSTGRRKHLATMICGRVARRLRAALSSLCTDEGTGSVE